MNQLVFDEATMINGNIFKFEDRIHNQVNRFAENGAILTKYYPQDENSSTVDRGLQSIDEIFGKHSPLKYNVIDNLPLYGFNKSNPENTDEQQIEDINVDGECVILPSTIVPKPMDFFIIKHLKMIALFQVVNVTYDSMKVDGFYRIRYHLYSTSTETVQQLESQVLNRYIMNMNAIGTKLNPVIQEDDFAYIGKVKQMMYKMIDAYRALFYNEKHNCFLFHHPEMGLDWFDMCGNHFMGKYSLMNYGDAGKLIVLVDKLHDKQFPIRYNNSIYNWLELGAPPRLLQHFHFLVDFANAYPYSSFVLWDEGDIQVMHPLSTREVGPKTPSFEFINEEQFDTLMNPNVEPLYEFDKLLWKYMYKKNINIHDVSLYIGDILLNSINHIDIFLYTPIIVFIIKKILTMN